MGRRISEAAPGTLNVNVGTAPSETVLLKSSDAYTSGVPALAATWAEFAGGFAPVVTIAVVPAGIDPASVTDPVIPPAAGSATGFAVVTGVSRVVEAFVPAVASTTGALLPPPPPQPTSRTNADPAQSTAVPRRQGRF